MFEIVVALSAWGLEWLYWAENLCYPKIDMWVEQEISLYWFKLLKYNLVNPVTGSSLFSSIVL